jgi:hypothetical protein
MTKSARVRDPLAPLDAVTGLLVTVLVIVFAAGTVAAVFTDGITFFDVNRDSICVETDGSLGSSSDLDAEDRESYGLRADVTTSAGRTRVCDPSPALADRVLVGLTAIPTFAVFVGFLVLTRRIIKYARRHAVFSASLASRIERLGWFLLVGLIAAAAVEWVARIVLLGRLVPHDASAADPLSVSVAGIIGAAGIISVGRIMARAAVMHDGAATATGPAGR